MYKIAVLIVLALSAAGGNLQPDDIPAYTTDNLYIQQQSITTESTNKEWAI